MSEHKSPRMRIEINSLNFPIWSADRRKVGSLESVVIKNRDGETRCIITPSQNPVYGGMPGMIDYKLHRYGVEYVAAFHYYLKNKDIPRTIEVGSARNLMRIAGLKPNGGKDYQLIKKYLTRMVGLKIDEYEKKYKVRSECGYIEFSESIQNRQLYDSAEFTTIMRGENIKVKNIRITLSEDYWNNLKYGHVKIIQLHALRRLKLHSAARLYELLLSRNSLKIRDRLGRPIIFYSQIVETMNLTRHFKRSLAISQLMNMFEELFNYDVLRDYEYSDTIASTGDIMISFILNNKLINRWVDIEDIMLINKLRGRKESLEYYYLNNHVSEHYDDISSEDVEHMDECEEREKENTVIEKIDNVSRNAHKDELYEEDDFARWVNSTD
jgi:hypothetical protein